MRHWPSWAACSSGPAACCLKWSTFSWHSSAKQVSSSRSFLFLLFWRFFMVDLTDLNADWRKSRLLFGWMVQRYVPSYGFYFNFFYFIFLVFGVDFLEMELITSTNFHLAVGIAFRARQLALFMEFLLLYKQLPLQPSLEWKLRFWRLLSGSWGRWRLLSGSWGRWRLLSGS